MSKKTLKIGGASGYWGDSDIAVPQLLKQGDLDYLVFDYLAEITMSIMARAIAKDPDLGYATDFVSGALKQNLKEISRQGIKVISNAGGMNPQACAKAVQALIDELQLGLKVATVLGDNLLSRKEELQASNVKEMFSGECFPEPETVASINAYLGAFPIAEALNQGADIVITGRCVDSAVTLGACIHEFGWSRNDYDALSGGSLAGHILECGPQATGGNYTDWEEMADSLHDAGYPIADISKDGAFVVGKPDNSGGAVTTGTVGEQMLYEIGDPQAYILPDVICDFSQVELIQLGNNRVSVTGAKGRAAPANYKASATFYDGWRIATVWFFIGENAAAKARSFADATLQRARNKLRAQNIADFDEVLTEVMGDESHYGAAAKNTGSREVTLKIAVKHQDPQSTSLVLKEGSGLALAAPPGLALFSGSRPKPSPVVRLFSLLIAKKDVPVSVCLNGETHTVNEMDSDAIDTNQTCIPEQPETNLPELTLSMQKVPLIKLALGRSGDKGNKANIGIFPRSAEFAPWIWQVLTSQEIAERFSHFLQTPKENSVDRYFLPGTNAMNFVLHDVLGGGGIASLRNDPQGKCYAQILLQTPIPIPSTLAETLS
ncbi:DUF1446 domain-containing protein [Sneathiella marina]|uniref:DUF1446 domain-containing protein n=1 Tax=Sneathiella marina TaxID=2950108 RepID=A0ABY4W9N2_9PROT|nr:acyclic terpene utilization AtuA family protein [Sneathiella marina]USG62470.1 DUF1446 domain-containing protein [Sneathiella marina]